MHLFVSKVDLILMLLASIFVSWFPGIGLNLVVASSQLCATSLSPACCALVSLSPMIILAGRDMKGGERGTCRSWSIAHGENLNNGDWRALNQDSENTYANTWKWERIVIYYELVPQWSAQISNKGLVLYQKKQSIQNKGGECATLLSKQKISL